MAQPLITAILNAHREGLLVKPSVVSFQRSIAQAHASGFEVEPIAILDRADAVTKQVIRLLMPDLRVIETDYGDPGQARNHGIAEAKGEYVAFLDADDLWGENWLVKALQASHAIRRRIIWHPELCVYFGAEEKIFCHADMEEDAFSPLKLMFENFWTVLSFGAREIYVETPYPETDFAKGLALEDWSWNMETISRGVVHKVVRGTAHLIRRKTNSSVTIETNAMRAVPRSAAYTRWMFAQRQRPQGMGSPGGLGSDLVIE